MSSYVWSCILSNIFLQTKIEEGEGEGGGVGAWFTVTLYSICNWLSVAADFKWPALFVTLNLKWRKKGWYVQYGNELQYK